MRIGRRTYPPPLRVCDLIYGVDLPQRASGAIAVAVFRWGLAGPLGAAMLRVEECGADHGHPNGRHDRFFLVGLRIDDEVQEALPRRPEHRAVLRIGDFDDDALAGLCRAALRELDVPVEVAGSFVDVPRARPSGDVV